MSTILLADDSPHAQRMGELILADEGYQVVTVSDGDTALLRLEDVNPDLVLADVVMPNRSGYELCQYIRMNPRHRRTRVILTVGAQEPLDEAEVARVKPDAVLKKPFEASVLLETVRPLAPPDGASSPVVEPEHRAASGRGRLPKVALIDPEQVRAAVTLALDASLAGMADQITEKVLESLSGRPGAARE